MKVSIRIFLTTIILAFVNSQALAQNCKEYFKDIPIEKFVATAGTWANFREQKGSVAFESKRLLDEAHAKLYYTSSPENICPNNCRFRKEPLIIFTSSPNKYLDNYPDKAHCLQLANVTKLNPLKFTQKTFSSISELSSWYAEFTQGKGKEGEELYQKCDLSCSPQYLSIIEEGFKKISINPLVVCGEARDKDNNQIVLETSFRWQCEEG